MEPLDVLVGLGDLVVGLLQGRRTACRPGRGRAGRPCATRSWSRTPARRRRSWPWPRRRTSARRGTAASACRRWLGSGLMAYLMPAFLAFGVAHGPVKKNGALPPSKMRLGVGVVDVGREDLGLAELGELVGALDRPGAVDDHLAGVVVAVGLRGEDAAAEGRAGRGRCSRRCRPCRPAGRGRCVTFALAFLIFSPVATSSSMVLGASGASAVLRISAMFSTAYGTPYSWPLYLVAAIALGSNLAATSAASGDGGDGAVLHELAEPVVGADDDVRALADVGGVLELRARVGDHLDRDLDAVLLRRTGRRTSSAAGARSASAQMTRSALASRAGAPRSSGTPRREQPSWWCCCPRRQASCRRRGSRTHRRRS